MVKVTLIGKYLSEKNNEFIFHGPLEKCKDCKLTHICFNLRPYHRYKIVNARNKHHTCSVHQSNVVVVEVDHLPILTAINKKFSKGSTVSIQKTECDHKLCPYHEFCTTPAIDSNHKYEIISVLKDIDCMKNKPLQIVEIVE